MRTTRWRSCSATNDAQSQLLGVLALVSTWGAADCICGQNILNRVSRYDIGVNLLHCGWSRRLGRGKAPQGRVYSDGRLPGQAIGLLAGTEERHETETIQGYTVNVAKIRAYLSVLVPMPERLTTPNQRNQRNP